MPNFLSSLGAHFSAAGDLNHFGDADGELESARTGVVVPLLHLGVIECAGSDARTFLHNQLTSDINHLGENAAQYSAWCTAKGRMLASFLVWRENGAYRLALAAELAEMVQKRLMTYRLRDKVDIGKLETLVLFGVAAPALPAVLEAAALPLPAAPLATAAAGDVRILRLDAERAIVALPAGQAEECWRPLAAQLRPAGLPVWRWLDINAGLPWITAATREEFVPQMADFDKIGGVSFHKGCYPGQEIVARTQYLGKVKRHLYRLRAAVPLAAGDDLHSPENPGQTSGKIVTAAPAPHGGYEALAVVQFNFARQLRLGACDGPAIEAEPVNFDAA